MEYKKEIIINKPVAATWEVLGPQFTDAHKWASTLFHSEGFGTPSLEGTSCSSRNCDSTIGNVQEVIRTMDHQNYILAYEVIKGLPSFVDQAINTWCLFPEGQQTRLQIHLNITTKGLVGSLMTPMLKLQMGKILTISLEDFQYYVEHDGTPHPRKVSMMEKKKKIAA